MEMEIIIQRGASRLYSALITARD